MRKTPMPDVVVVIPGITGSVLEKDGEEIWGLSRQAVWSTLSTLGKSLQAIEIKGKDDPEAEDLGDGIKATKLIEDAHLIPGLSKIDGYTAVSRAITDFFDVTPGKNFFQFPYDWRRDNRANARLLKRFLDKRLNSWRESPSGDNNAKVIILAHSMGGLISRYYLEVLDGWRDCKALFTFGTSYRGSVDAVNFLANGYKKYGLDLTEILHPFRSFTSIYQLLPIYKMLEVGDKYHRIAEAPDNLPNIVKVHAENALKFHEEIENAVNSHMKDVDYRRLYQTIPIVGIEQPTMQSASWDGKKITVSKELPKNLNQNLCNGDGTVPFASAIPFELSEAGEPITVVGCHSSIQNNGLLLDKICDLIKRKMPIPGLKEVRDPGIKQIEPTRAAISLDLDDLYLANGPVEIRAEVRNYNNDLGTLKAKIKSVSDSSIVRDDFQQEDEQWVLRLNNLAPGLYRVEVRAERNGEQAPLAINDLFEVVKPI
jgi:pimeloyl-ACP methyl ester carboxylesterase